MKNNQLALMLAGLFALSAVLNVWFCFRYASAYHKLRVLQPQTVRIATARNLMAALFNDASEYGKKNPDIQHLLQPYAAPTDALKAGTGTAAPAIR